MEVDWKLHRRRPIATYMLIAINIAIYIISSYQNFLSQISDDWVTRYAFVPIMLQEPMQWYRIFTSMFLHGDILHIFFNMWFLYMFGKEVELSLGITRYLAIYFLSGISATLFHTAFVPVLGSINLLIPALGASGAISGVLGAYMMMYPRRRLSACWFLFILPFCFTTSTSFFMLFWFATQVIYGYLRFGSVAFFAHVGGFLGGITFLYTFLRKTYRYEQLILPWGFTTTIERGLSKLEKLIFATLVIAVIGGTIYSYIIASQMTNVYMINIRACMNNVCSSDKGAFDPSTNDNIPPSEDYPRIVFNRFVWAGLLKYKQNYEGILQYSHSVPTSFGRGITVLVDVYGWAEYDSKGVLIYFNGSVTTQVIQIDRFFGIVRGIEGPYTYDVNISSSDVAQGFGENFVRPMALISTFISIVSLIVSMYKDKELSMEEYWGYQPFIYAPI